jgi:hypothetical protein
VDGRFTNKTFLRQIPPRTVILGRLRKDSVIHQLPQIQPVLGRKRKYGPLLPTPEQRLKDPSVPFERVRAFAAGKWHQFKVKRLGPVVLRLDRAARPVQVLAIKPLGCPLTVGGRLLYRQPAYLIGTDPQMAVQEFLQHFLWRWDIEVNFRDEKTLLGVGQAQVWAAAWTCSWRAGLKMWPLAGTPTQKRRQGFKPVAGGEDCWVYGASI